MYEFYINMKEEIINRLLSKKFKKTVIFKAKIKNSNFYCRKKNVFI